MTSASQINIDCPKCLASLQVPSEKGGQRIVCPECKRSLLVPEAQTAGNTIFDDLFDGDNDTQPSSVESESNPPTVPEITPEPAKITPEPASSATPDVSATPKESAEPSTPRSQPQKNDVVIDDSAFDDIDKALEQHQESGTDIAPTPSQPVSKPEPELPPVQTIEEEIELPESNASPLPDLPIEMTQTVGSDQDITPALDVDLPEGRLEIQDEFSLEEHLEVPDLNLDPIATNDPFETSSDEPLRIDGISPTVSADDIHGVKCKVCDTRIHITADQEGNKIECPVCFSEVTVSIGKQSVMGEENRPVSNSQLQMAPVSSVPTTEPKIGATIAPDSSKEPDADDEGIFALEPLQDNGPNDLGLSLETRDLLQPTEKDEPKIDEDSKSGGVVNSSSGSSEVNAEYGSKDYWESKVTEVEDVEDTLPEIMLTKELTPQAVLGWLSNNFTSPDLIFRTLLAIALMAITYVMFDIFHASYNDKNIEYFNKILGTVIPCVVGGITLAIGVLVLFTTCSMVFQNSASGVAKTEEWPGFSFGDWLGPLAFYLFSFWLGCLPGGFFGAIVALALGANTWIVVAASLTTFILAPLLWTSACYNGSAFNVYAKDVVSSYGFEQVDWLYYLPYVLGIWFAFFIGTMILFLPTFIFSGIGAAIQVVMLICFSSVAGVHAGRVVTQLQKR